MPRQGNFNPSHKKKSCGVCAVKYKTGTTTINEDSGSYYIHTIQWHDSKASRGCVVVRFMHHKVLRLYCKNYISGGHRNHSWFITERILWIKNFLAELYLNVIRKVERSPVTMGQMTRCPFKQKRSARLKCSQRSLNTVAVHSEFSLHPQWHNRYPTSFLQLL